MYPFDDDDNDGEVYTNFGDEYYDDDNIAARNDRSGIVDTEDWSQ